MSKPNISRRRSSRKQEDAVKETYAAVDFLDAELLDATKASWDRRLAETRLLLDFIKKLKEVREFYSDHPEWLQNIDYGEIYRAVVDSRDRLTSEDEFLKMLRAAKGGRK